MPAQARVQLPWEGLRGTKWQLVDLLNEERWERDGDELAGAGLYVDLAPWGGNFFTVQRL